MQLNERRRNKLPLLLFAGLSGSVFFLFFGLAVGGGLPVDFGLLGCLGVAACALLCSPKLIWERIAALMVRGKLLSLLPLFVYLCLDFFGFLFSGEFSLLWEKYRVTGLLFLVMGMMLLAGARQAYYAVFAGAAMAAALASLLTLLRYFGGGATPLPYLLRFSLRRDYNMYAATLLIGWVCLFFWLVGEKKRDWALAGSVLILPVLALSGSRRVLLALPFVLAGGLLADLLPLRRGKESGRWAASLLLCGLLVWGATIFLERALAGLSADPQSAVRLDAGLPDTGQTAAAQRYETIGHESLFTKRKVIWHIAVDELGRYTLTQWLFGRGGGENIRLYDRIDEALDVVYPDREARRGALSAHNMLLADVIDGGLLKAGALCWLLAVCVWGCLMLLIRDWRRGIAVGMILGFTILSNLVSNRYGLLYDRGFMLFYPLLLLEVHTERKGSHEPSDRNADYPASP